MRKVILVTGAAGFIGFSVCKAFLKKNSYTVIGIDNMNNYYDVELKKTRLDYLNKISTESNIFLISLFLPLIRHTENH